MNAKGQHGIFLGLAIGVAKYSFTEPKHPIVTIVDLSEFSSERFVQRVMYHSRCETPRTTADNAEKLFVSNNHFAEEVQETEETIVDVIRAALTTLKASFFNSKGGNERREEFIRNLVTIDKC